MILPQEWTRLTVRLLCDILFFAQMHHCSILPPTDISELSRGSPCRPTPMSDRYYPGHDYTVHVGPGLDTSRKRCCWFRKCSPGTHGIICDETDPESTECRTCDANHYSPRSTSSDDARRFCVGNKRVCGSQGEYLKKSGSAMKDNVCGCDAAAGYYNSDTIHDRVICRRKRCAAGTQMSEKHGCVPCPKGTFKPSKGNSLCKIWTIPSENIPLWVLVLLIVLSAAAGIPVIITAVYLVRKRRPCKNGRPERDPSGNNNAQNPDVGSNEQRLMMGMTSGPVEDVDPEVSGVTSKTQNPDVGSSEQRLLGATGIDPEVSGVTSRTAITEHGVANNNIIHIHSQLAIIGNGNQANVAGDQPTVLPTSPKETVAKDSTDS